MRFRASFVIGAMFSLWLGSRVTGIGKVDAPPAHGSRVFVIENRNGNLNDMNEEEQIEEIQRICKEVQRLDVNGPDRHCDRISGDQSQEAPELE